MPNATDEFFEALGRRGHEPLLAQATATLRFDLKEDGRTTHWLVNIKKGDLKVSRENREADGVVATQRAVFDEIVSGNMNVLTAMLRGLVSLEGSVELVVRFQRLFPSPPNARERGRAAAYARRQS
jgi:putative sterol carrier protein